jgi:hypothetical protein
MTADDRLLLADAPTAELAAIACCDPLGPSVTVISHRIIATLLFSVAL